MMYNLHTRVHSSDTHTHTKMSAYFYLIRTFIFPIWHLLSFKSINIYSPPVICSSFKIRFTNEYAWKYAVDYLCQCIVVAAAASAGVVVLVFFVKKVSSTSNTMCQIDAIWIMRRNAIMVIQPSFFVCVRVWVRYLFIGQLLCNERTVPMSCPIFEQTKNKQETFAHHFNQFSP